MILDIDQLNLAVNAIAQGGVIAYPTEAVWGLGCAPWNKDAVYRLLDIKAPAGRERCDSGWRIRRAI